MCAEGGHKKRILHEIQICERTFKLLAIMCVLLREVERRSFSNWLRHFWGIIYDKCVNPTTATYLNMTPSDKQVFLHLLEKAPPTIYHAVFIATLINA